MVNSFLQSTIFFTGVTLMVACNTTNLSTIKHQTSMFTPAQVSNAPLRQKFTVEQLTAAHGKVKSGADFPSYIREIKELGVTHYETYVADGHINYHRGSDYTVTVPAKYDPMLIADTINLEIFKRELAAHQQGKTDFLTFITMCATTGIEQWQICIDNMTCTYSDKAGNEVFKEAIPR